MRKVSPRVSRVLDSRGWATWLTFALGAVLFATMVFLTRAEDRKASLLQESEWLETLTRVVEKNLDNQFHLANRALDGMVLEPSMASSTLEQLGGSLPGVRTLMSIDKNGLVKASSRPELIGMDFSSQDYFLAAKQRPLPGQFSLSPPYESVLGVMILNGVKVVLDSRGAFAGIVVAALDPEYYKVVLDSVRDHLGSWARLYHGAGYQYLTMTEGSTLLTSILVGAGTPFAEFQRSGMAYWNQTNLQPAPGGFPSMSSFRQIQPVGVPLDFPLVVEIGQDLTSLRNSWGQADLFSWGAYALISFTLGLLFLFVRTRQNRHQRESLRYNEMLQEGAMRFQLATEAAHLGVWEWNAATDLLSWDTQMFRLYGVDKGDFQPKASFWEALIWDEEKSSMRGFLATAASLRTGGAFRCRIRHSDGKPRWIQFQYRYHTNGGGEGRLVGINSDITLDVTSARALLESERFLKTVTEAAPSLIAYYDRQMVCRFANSRYTASHGFEPGELEGKDFTSILGEQLVAERMPAILDALSGTATDLQTTTVDLQGQEHSFWVHYIPDKQDDGVAGFFVLVDDLTELRTAQKELEAQQGKLILNARMAQMGELLSQIAHQWRQPLTVIGALVGNIQLRSQLGSLNMTYLAPKLDKISQTVLFLSETIESFRNFYAPSKKKNVTDLADLTRRAVDLLSPAFQKYPYEIRLIPPEAPLKVLVNQSELMQVIIEILGNARNALGDKTGWIQLRLASRDDRAVLEISNNGGPIPPSVLPHIFEPYFTTKNSETGTGMGLYMARLIVENHHEGQLLVGCTGEVTSFLIELSLHKEDSHE